ncbi:MAG: phage integrase SAM-like domain-containing protein [Desulfobacterium sp.]|nr:phage integrase SAM-like domain-containing protein [Desulfobacterium sp.]
MAEKLFNEIKKKQLYKKIGQIDSKNSLTISDFIETYTTDPTRTRQDGEGISPHTIRADKLAFRLLKDAIGDLNLNAINEKEIKDFMITTSCRVKPASLNNYLAHIRAGLNWAKDEGHIKRVPRIKLVNLKKGKVDP